MRLCGYHDSSLCDFLEFGWPIGYTSLATPASTHANHGSAVAAPEVVQAYLDKEQNLGSLCGPFNTNPLTKDLVISPMQIVYSRSGKSRVVVDLSFPVGSSVNDGIPKDTYLDEPFTLRLPGTDAFVDIIRALGAGCWLFKKDLSRAYRQLRIDLRDYHLLGLLHHNNLYFDIAPPFGLRSAAMMCQRTTSAVTYMFQSMGYHCTNYIDDFGGADSAENAQSAFRALGDLFSTLGLEWSPDKDCEPSQSMVFLGILFNSVDMTMSVTTDRLTELLSRCQSLLDSSVVCRRDLQSLLGVMAFVTACVRPARIFMSSLLNTLRAHSSSRLCSLTPENKSDLRWWCHFVPSYNGVSLIKTAPWIHDSLSFSTDACGSGAGGYFNGEFFHTPFPHPIMLLYGHDINILELLTIMVALKLWGTALHSQRVIISCDNENSVFALNSGRSRTPGMQRCLREIWFLSAVFDFEIRADHVLGVSNAIADHLSRWHLSPSHKAHFEALTSGIPTTFIPCPSELFNFDVSF